MAELGQETVENNVITLMPAQAATGESDAIDCSNADKFTLQIIAADTAIGTVDIETSLNGIDWGKISENPISADGSTIISVSNEIYKWVRANVSAYTSGNFKVLMVK